MKERDWLEIVDGQLWSGETNRYEEKYGLQLSEKDAEVLIVEKENLLRAGRRIEFGSSL